MSDTQSSNVVPVSNNSNAASSSSRPIRTVPLWAQFTIQLANLIEREKIELIRDESTESGYPENKNWVRIEHRGSGNKTYIPKGKTAISHLETTIELSPDPIRGVKQLPKSKNGNPYKNGLIRSHLEPDPEKAAIIFIEAIKNGIPKPAKRIAQTQQQQPTPTAPQMNQESETMTVTEEVGAVEEVLNNQDRS